MAMDKYFGNTLYRRLKTFKTKGEAQRFAKQERKLGYYARVSKELDKGYGQWVVWINIWSKRRK